jgi:hypothetical protein
MSGSHYLRLGIDDRQAAGLVAEAQGHQHKDHKLKSLPLPVSRGGRGKVVGHQLFAPRNGSTT